MLKSSTKIKKKEKNNYKQQLKENKNTPTTKKHNISIKSH